MKKTLLFYLISICSSLILNSQTTFAALQNIDSNTGDDPYEIASGDLDDDGFVDLVIATYFYNGGTPAQDYIKWYKNDGNGNFTLQSTVSSSIRWVDGLFIANIDGQNGNDIVATSTNQNKLVYFPSDGLGGFGSEVTVGGTINGPGQVFVADINNDGNMDLATVAYDDDEAIWFAGDGSGNFGAKQIIASGTTNGPFEIGFADIDNDTDMDALVGYFNNGSIEIYYNQYIESGTMTVSWIKDAVTVDSGNPYLQVALFADVNNDGVKDVVKLDNSSGEVEWFDKIKNGTSTPHTISDNTIIKRPGTVFVTDLDNDTYNDVIVTDGGSIDDAVIWFKGANNASPSSTPSLVGDNNYQIFAVTVDDFDYDGDNDIAFVGFFSNTLDWYENELISLGTNDESKNKISIYPNPTKNQLYFKGFSESFDVSVYDILGKNVLNKNLDLNASLDVSKLQNGIYIIKFKDYNSTFKFVKQ